MSQPPIRKEWKWCDDMDQLQMPDWYFLFTYFPDSDGMRQEGGLFGGKYPPILYLVVLPYCLRNGTSWLFIIWSQITSNIGDDMENWSLLEDWEADCFPDNILNKICFEGIIGRWARSQFEFYIQCCTWLKIYIWLLVSSYYSWTGNMVSSLLTLQLVLANF